jgi:prepilin-type N-terminal cleavage/methylation domain-containing protein
MQRKFLKTKCRAAFTLAEMVVALALFGVAAVAVGQLTILARKSQQSSWEEHVAGEALANLAEEVSVLPWEELSAEGLEKLELSEDVRNQLPTAELHVSVDDVAGDIVGKQIALELSFGEHAPRRQLTVWRFSAEGKP